MKKAAAYLKSLCIAFSMFSRLPMPHFTWEEDAMRDMLAFFPLVGLVIGAAVYFWGTVCSLFAVNRICYSFIGAAIPLFLSGGIHADGYMDTMDALCSCRSREKKLEILKDAHIGAFAVLALLLYYLVYIGAFSEIEGTKPLLLLGGGFYLSRILSALAILYFPCAKKEGLASLFAAGADRRKVRRLLLFQLLLCMLYFLSVSFFAGGAALLTAFTVLVLYYRKTKKEFGGVTGDTAGCFTLCCEAAILVVLAVCIY